MNAKQTLIQHHQQHLVSLLDTLCGEELARFEKQVAQIDWSVIEEWRPNRDLGTKGEIEPISGLSLPEIHRSRAAFAKVGTQALRQGKVGAVMLAGGQGTRLGFDAPKGAYNIGISHPMYIFERQIANLKEVCDACGRYVPLFVMTSEQNDAYTRDFLRRHGYFGYPEDFVRFFVQDMAPVVDFDGKLVLSDRATIAMSPNGNGGWYSSLAKSNVLSDFAEVEWLNVFAVDNVLQRIADPIFVGATVSSGCNCGAKAVRKCDPREKVGVLCMQNGAPSVVEYFELTEEMANARDADGNLVYGLGVILNYLFRRQALADTANERIPIHVVKKKVPTYVDGKITTPQSENVFKFETLAVDLVHIVGTCLPFEVVREREFAPIKNKTGVDSVESARRLLQQNGIAL